jgi:hypothetical protein
LFIVCPGHHKLHQLFFRTGNHGYISVGDKVRAMAKSDLLRDLAPGVTDQSAELPRDLNRSDRVFLKARRQNQNELALRYSRTRAALSCDAVPSKPFSPEKENPALLQKMRLPLAPRPS